VNPHDILRIKGLRAVQEYLLNEVQELYRLHRYYKVDVESGASMAFAACAPAPPNGGSAAATVRRW
jgi:hypothetical protein